MRAPSVIIIASPYEGELLGRALADTGLRILRADGGDGAGALLATELPLAVVIGTDLLHADTHELVAQARSRHHARPLFLLASAQDPAVDILRAQVTSVFRRPQDFEALAAEIERLAVAAERAELEDVEELGGVDIIEEAPLAATQLVLPPPIPRVPTQRMHAEPTLAPVRPAYTEALGVSVVGGGLLGEGSGGFSALPTAASPAPSHTNGRDASPSVLLRADEALGALMDLELESTAGLLPARGASSSREGGLRKDVPSGAGAGDNPSRGFEARSTIAREIDRELTRAERRLFPGEAPTPLPLGQLADYEDALGDIDLDSFAIDTIPGLSHGLRLNEPRARLEPSTEIVAPSAPPPALVPARPVQEEGTLDELDVAELLARLHANAFTGALHLERPEADGVVAEKTLFLDHGEPVGARSSLRHDHLAELLFREGKLTREQAARARGEAAGAEAPMREGGARRVALRLVELGLLKESELFPVIRHHVEELFFSLFALAGGRYRLGPSLLAPEDRVRLSAAPWAMIMEGVRRKYGLERLSDLLGGRAAVLHPTTLFSRAIEASALSAEERRVVALIDGARTLGEVRASLGARVSESTVFAVVFGLRAIGALDSGGGAMDLRDAATVVTLDPGGDRRAQPRPTDPVQLAAERAVERERIAVKRAQILDADYFAILGVARDVSEHELRRAHGRLRADFDPTCFSEETLAEHSESLGEIREVLDEALRVLCAAKVRARYAAQLEPNERGGEA